MIPVEDGPFAYFAKIDKIYRKMCGEAVAEYDFTPAEIVVLMFLSNHPDINTSRDIASYRNISKGLVARAVDSLCSRGYLYAKKDEVDRRLLHLHISSQCGDVVERLQKFKRLFWQEMHRGIPEEQMEIFQETIQRMYDNVNHMSYPIKEE